MRGQICAVLTSPNHSIANETILRSLMEKVKCTNDIVEFCDQLEKIASQLSDPGILATIANEIKTGTLAL